MAGKSKIEWTGETWNVIRSCSRVSKGCRHCYAERQAVRQCGPGKAYEGLVQMTPRGRRWTGVTRVVEELIEKPLYWRQPRTIFVNSMSDFFHETILPEDIERIWGVMERANWHTYQILTKRPERMANWMSRYNITAPPHIWLGVSAEDQKTFDYRVPYLFKIKASIRWASLEPLLNPITFANIFPHPSKEADNRNKLDWVVVGGESGSQARPMEFDWVRKLRDEAAVYGIPFFFKQTGRVLARNQGYNDKGGNPEHWPEDLRIRQYPPNILKKD